MSLNTRPKRSKILRHKYFVCGICDFILEDPLSLIKHTVDEHSGECTSDCLTSRPEPRDHNYASRNGALLNDVSSQTNQLNGDVKEPVVVWPKHSKYSKTKSLD